MHSASSVHHAAGVWNAILAVISFLVPLCSASSCTHFGSLNGGQAFYCTDGKVCSATSGEYYTSNACVSCPSGKYENGRQYSYASNSYYWNATYNTDNLCTSASAGYYTVNINGTQVSSQATRQVRCEQGYYSTGGNAACTIVSTGFVPVDANNNAVNIGAVNQASCPAGRYNTGQGLTACVSCEAGKYSTDSSGGKHRAGSCTDVSVGYYATDGISVTERIANRDGAVVYHSLPRPVNTAATAQSACPAGRYSVVADMDDPEYTLVQYSRWFSYSWPFIVDSLPCGSNRHAHRTALQSTHTMVSLHERVELQHRLTSHSCTYATLWQWHLGSNGAPYRPAH